MEITETDLRVNYSAHETEYLVELRDGGTLTDLARDVLDQVLNERGVSIGERERISTAIRTQIDEEERAIYLASLGTRFLAKAIDLAIVYALLLVSVFILWTGSSAFSSVGIILALAYLLVALAYQLLADGLPKGQSLGKKLISVAVVDVRTGVPCTLYQSLIRNLLFFFLGVFELLFIIFGRKRQRLGDLAARTIVVKVRNTTAHRPNPGR